MTSQEKFASLDRAYGYIQDAVTALDTYAVEVGLSIYSREGYDLECVRDAHLEALDRIGCDMEALDPNRFY